MLKQDIHGMGREAARIKLEGPLATQQPPGHPLCRVPPVARIDPRAAKAVALA